MKTINSSLFNRFHFLSPTLLLAAFLSAGWQPAAAAPVNSQRAAAAVRGWLKGDSRPLGEALGSAVQRVETFKDSAGAEVYHVVYLEPSGFVILAADDQVEPIVCFAPAGHFDPSTDNPLGALVSRDIPGRVARARQSGGMPALKSAALQAQGKWLELGQIGTNGSIRPNLAVGVSDVRIAPLIQSTWNQQTAGGAGSAACYNYYTPPYAAGSTANYPAGCVATAMGQLMRYYQFPSVGVGSAAFPITVDGSGSSYSLRGGDGAGGPYLWGSMPLVPPGNPTVAQCQAIGGLLADAGATVQMAYSASGSASILLDANNALRGTFHYGNAIRGWNNNADLGANLVGIINPNLDAHGPVLLGIQGAGGHAVVADGYGYSGSTLYHHLNLGWSGTSTAWYTLPTIDTINGTFTVIDQCAYNVYTNGSGEIISGRVLDQASRPVANATVTATRTGGGGGPYTATTDTQGIYALARIPSASQYSLTVSAAGYGSAGGAYSTGTSTDNQASSGNYWGANFTLPTLATAPDHFVWSAIPSTQAVNTAFGVTLTAQNVTNGVIAGFAGTTALRGYVTGFSSTNTILGNLSWQTYWTFSLETTVGYAFTPTNNLQVFYVRSYNGDKVSIWTDAGALLASQSVTSTPGTWVETALATPITLSAGTTYRVSVHYPASTPDYSRTSWPTAFANGAVGQNYYNVAGDGFPSQTMGTGQGPLVDLRYAVCYSNAISISPTSASSFVNGVWSGTLTALQTATNLVVQADDGAGHSGVSGAFNVIDPNAVPPNITTQPQNQTNNTGDNVTFTVAATGSPSYFWRRNGSPILGGTSPSYTTNNVQLPDSGSQFSCIVSNTYGSRTSQVATLTVVCTNVAWAVQPQLTLVGGGEINAVAPLPDGALIVGGFFTNINGSTRYCIARLLPDGTLDPNWNPAANSTVYALAVSGTNVYAGGYFTRIGSFSRGGIARLSAGGTGAVDATWNPNATDVSYSPYVDTIAVSDTNVYVGGYFTSIGGQARNSIAKLTAVGTGTADAAWNPNAGAGAYTVLVDATVVSGTNLYVGGYFTSIGGQARNCLARLSLSGSGAADATWNPNALGEVLALAVSGTDLYAGGAFGTIGNLTRNSIAKLSTGGTGATDPAWNPNADSEVDSIALEGTYVYAGGSFTNIGGMHRNCLAKLTSSGAGGADATWEADANNTVYGIAPGRTNLYVAGAFTQISGQPRAGVASLAFAPFKLGSPRYSGTQFQLTVTSEKGLCFEIQATTNLVDWTTISTLTNSAGVTNCTDPILTLPRRFYRAHQLQ